MSRSLELTLVAMLAVPLVLTGCEGPPVDGDAPTSQQSAIMDGTKFTTSFTPTVSMAATSDRLFAVWAVTDPSNHAQVAGQMFTLTGQAITPSQIYSTGSDIKGEPKVSVIAIGADYRFLITYSDAFMNTNDTDIWGITVDAIGTRLAEFHVNFDSSADAAESIAVVPTSSGTKWLVSYAENGPVRSYRANWVDTAGTVTGPFTLFSSAPDLITAPTAVYGTTGKGIRRLLFSVSPKTYAFGSPDTLAVGPLKTVPANGTVNSKVVAYNARSSTFGMAWFDQEQSGRMAIRSKTFTESCQDFTCGDPETAPSPITNFVGSSVAGSLLNPVITSLDVGFAIFAGKQFAGAPELYFSWIDGHGRLGATGFPSMAACANRQGAPDATPLQLAATSAGGTGRAWVIYDTFCSPGNKIAAAGWDLTLTKTPFPVSD